MTSRVDTENKMATGDLKSMFLKRELDVSTKMSNLEKKAGQLEKDFNDMLLAAREMELSVRKYVKKAETEQKSWEILEKMTETDVNICDVLDHVKIFFNFVLAKMKVRSADITDVKMLWRLIDCEGISQCFNDVIIQCGFTRDDLENMRTLVSVVSKIQEDLEGKEGTEELVDALIWKTEQIIEIENASQPHGKTQNSDVNDGTDIRNAGNTASVDDTNVTTSLDGLLIKETNGSSVDGSNIDDLYTNPGVKDTYIIKDEGKDETANPTIGSTESEGTDVDEVMKPSKKVANDHVVPIREALKRIKFLDIGDDMRELIKQIVRYVTQIMND